MSKRKQERGTWRKQNCGRRKLRVLVVGEVLVMMMSLWHAEKKHWS